MRQVSILKTIADTDTLEIRDRVVTAFIVTPDGIGQVSIEEEPVPSSLKLLDPGSGDAITLESDPVRWADLLPTAYRGGDYHVAVDVAEEDDMLIRAAADDGGELAELVEQF